jgi:hypothetical protein
MHDSFSKTIFHNHDIIFVRDKHKNTTECFNSVFNKNPDYDFYHTTNDDVIYRSAGWDLMLANKNRISYANDLCQNHDICTFPMIDGRIVRALGWLQMPKLQFMCGDLVWKTIGNKLNILKYFPEIIIEHLHWSNNKREVDSVTKNVNSTEIMRADNIAFRQWLHNDMEKDIGKIKHALAM